ncbi:MAG TPA: branched-chain amino acid ABC transporter permease [Acidimicrobiales bacterium]|nr:branched-chain amino acid ABC transporter permease [Acidimicrobiales bacterium]
MTPSLRALGARSRGVRWQWSAAAAALVALFAAAAVFPHVANGYELFVGTEIAIFAIACLGLTVAIGWSGQVVLAQTGFFGIGAYGTNYLFEHHVPWVVSVLAISLLCALCGMVVGFPAARLRGFYLAIATLAFAELLDQLFNNATAITGGPVGMAVVPFRLWSLGVNVGLWYLSFVVLVATVVVLNHLGRSRLGRCLRAVRDAEVATGSLGLSATQLKVVAFVISALLGSIAGSLYGQALTFLSPDAFSLNLVIEFLVVVFIGGVDKLSGAIVGAAFLVLIQEALQSFGAYQRLIFGVALVLVVRFLPGGLVSLVPLVRARWRSRRSRPEPAAPQPVEVSAA